MQNIEPIPPLVTAYIASRDALRPFADRLAKAALAVGDAVATGGEATPKAQDELHDAACAWRDEVRRVP